MSAHLTLHGTSRELYDMFPVAEETSNGYAWKSVETDNVKITFFPTNDVPAEAAREEVSA